MSGEKIDLSTEPLQPCAAMVILPAKNEAARSARVSRPNTVRSIPRHFHRWTNVRDSASGFSIYRSAHCRDSCGGPAYYGNSAATGCWLSIARRSCRSCGGSCVGGQNDVSDIDRCDYESRRHSTFAHTGAFHSVSTPSAGWSQLRRSSAGLDHGLVRPLNNWHRHPPPKRASEANDPRFTRTSHASRGLASSDVRLGAERLRSAATRETSRASVKSSSLLAVEFLRA